VLAVERNPFAAQHRDDDLQRLLELLEAIGERAELDAERLVLELEQPAPMPSCARPPDTMSSVVTVFASTAGLRYVLPVTRPLRRTVDVSLASADSSE